MEIPRLNHRLVAGLFQRPSDPFRPSFVLAGVADEKISWFRHDVFILIPQFHRSVRRNICAFSQPLASFFGRHISTGYASPDGVIRFTLLSIPKLTRACGWLRRGVAATFR